MPFEIFITKLRAQRINDLMKSVWLEYLWVERVAAWQARAKKSPIR